MCVVHRESFGYFLECFVEPKFLGLNFLTLNSRLPLFVMYMYIILWHSVISFSPCQDNDLGSGAAGSPFPASL